LFIELKLGVYELAFDLEADGLHCVCKGSVPEAFGYAKIGGEGDRWP